MRIRELPEVDVLTLLLRYVPETGKLYWKRRDVSLFKDTPAQSAKHNAAIWNAKNADKEAFTTKLANGHRYSSIYRVKCLAHRVIWKMAYGEDPVLVVDHEDGNPDNNRLTNLRMVTQTVNSRNAALSKSNSSGFNGVWFDVRRGKWNARICVDRKSIHLGSFLDVEDAVAARKKADVDYGFHETHGRRQMVADADLDQLPQ